MKYRGYRVDVTLAVALLTLAVLLGGRLAYARFLVERPLVAELEALSGVQSVTLERSDAGYVLHLKLAEVKDLPGLYRQIEKLGASRMSVRRLSKASITASTTIWKKPWCRVTSALQRPKSKARPVRQV